uniref:Secreted protein n=1 Tax=Anopheles coluzzii TaxID=1518534 RepID=A0A6E8VPS8_ANOCL
MGRVMCLLRLMSTLLVVLSIVGKKANAAPQVTEAPGNVGSTYSPMADIGRLATGATRLFGQFWNTGTRFGTELSRRTFDFLRVKK